MDTSDPEIVFDENGNCNHCNTFLIEKPKQSYKGQIDNDTLSQIVKQIKNKRANKKYDCVLVVSGGAGGCYVAYM